MPILWEEEHWRFSFLNKSYELDEFLSHYRNRIATEANQIVDLSTLSTNFTYTVKEPIRVPFCHASCLCKTQVARRNAV